MNRFDALDASLPITDIREDTLVGLLREASLALDGMLESALANSDTTVVDLGEASQAVHRALVALTAG